MICRGSTLTCTLMVFSTTLCAEEAATVQQVIVTAQKKVEPLQDVPISITALDRDELQRRGITTAGEALAATPSVTVAPYLNSTNTFFLYMRGVGVNDPGQIATDGSVGLYEDGFYISRPQGVGFDLSDIERVEVLRGPQGTLYGRNTMGGAVNLISRPPIGALGFRQELDAGNQGYFRSLSVLDTPTWKSASAKISLLTRSIDGAVADPGHDRGFGAESQEGGKLQLRWDPSDTARLDYFGDYLSIDSTPNYVVNTAFANNEIVPGVPYIAPYERPDASYRPLDLPLSNTRSSMHGLTLTWSGDPDLTLKSLTGYRTLNANSFQNYNEVYGLPGFNSHNLIKDHQFSQELQAIGRIAGWRAEFVAGIYHFEEGASNHLDGGAAGLGVFDTRDESEKSLSNAIYGQATWAATSSLELTIGGRYTRDSKRGVRTRSNSLSKESETNAVSEVRDSRFTPSFTATQRLTEDASTYFRAATGYKSGAPNANAPIGGFSQTYGPESLVSYEIGLKSLWLERRTRFNLALFETKYKDQQRAFQVAPTVFDYDAFNVGRETFRGMELDIASNPMRDLSVALNYAYLFGRIDQLKAPANTIFDPAVNPFSTYKVGDDVRGLFDPSQGYSPRHSVDVTADYVLARLAHGDVSSHVEYRWQAKREGVGPEVPGREFATAPAYGVLSGNLAWRRTLSDGKEVTVTLWGRNLLDTKVPVWVSGFGSVVPVSAAPAGYTGSVYEGWVEPRRYGLSLVYQW